MAAKSGAPGAASRPPPRAGWPSPPARATRGAGRRIGAASLLPASRRWPSSADPGPGLPRATSGASRRRRCPRARWPPACPRAVGARGPTPRRRARRDRAPPRRCRDRRGAGAAAPRGRRDRRSARRQGGHVAHQPLRRLAREGAARAHREHEAAREPRHDQDAEEVQVDAGVEARHRSGQFPDQHVADAAHGLDVARLLRVVLELGAQLGDVDVDGAVERLVTPRP